MSLQSLASNATTSSIYDLIENDNGRDTETIHTIKNIFYNDEVRYNDIAIVELQRSVNDCTDAENWKCWPITPVLLPSPEIVVTDSQIVRALGM